jgi:pyruvate formate lyase activating enzyme
MSYGIVFDIQEFSVHDGPGIRTTVFMKGCPLACMWCHNPESQSTQPQVIRNPFGERIAGKEYSSQHLAALLNQQSAILKTNGGGVTFSGGEPLSQAAFIADVIDAMDDLNIILDTSGYGSRKNFLLLLERLDLIFYDLKLIDPGLHKHYTGMDNHLILENLQLLNESGKPFVIRVPLVPEVTDSDENLKNIALTVRHMKGLEEINLLSYNHAAGSKYENAGMQFKPDYDENRPLNRNLEIFEREGIKVKCL